MTMPVQPVTCRFFDQDGAPIAAKVSFKLTVQDVYNGIIVGPTADYVICDPLTGTGVINLFPNALGANGSQYTVKAVDSVTGRKILAETLCTIPDSPCYLDLILNQEPFPAVDAAQQALAAAQGALALITAQTSIATAKAVLTAADVVLTHADVIAVQADADATHADMLQADADAAQTALDRIATAADLAQTTLDRAATNTDAAQTALDAIATAADRVQTGLDKAATAASEVIASSQAGVATTKAGEAAASEATATNAASTATTQAGVATTRAGEAAASAVTASAKASESTASAIAAAASAASIASGPVISVNGKTDVVVLVKADISLGNANNTSDADKPVSTAQLAALNLKANLASPTFTGTVSGITSAMVGAQPAGTYASGTGSASGVNTGDETTATIKTKLGVTTLSGSNTGDQTIPTTLPASDVSAWAKATTKPSYTATEVGLGNVDNTSDATKDAATSILTNKTITDPTIDGVKYLETQSQLTFAVDYAIDQAAMANKRVSDATTFQTQTGTASFTQAASTDLIRTYATATVNLPKAFKNTDYQVVIEPVSATPALGFQGEITVQSRTVNSFVLQMSGSATACSVRWKVIHPNAEGRVHVVLPTAQ